MGEKVNNIGIRLESAFDNQKYKEKLLISVNSIMDKDIKIRTEDLNNNPTYKNAYNNMSLEKQEIINEIVGYDNYDEFVSRDELKTILMIMDAEMDKNSGNEYYVDGNIRFTFTDDINKLRELSKQLFEKLNGTWVNELY